MEKVTLLLYDETAHPHLERKQLITEVIYPERISQSKMSVEINSPIPVALTSLS